jgi:hypothetical protein
MFVVEEQEESNSSNNSDRSEDNGSGNDDSSSDAEEKHARSSESDSDATTASYSSLEDEEADGNDKHQKNDNADAGNGNDSKEASKVSSIAKLIKEMAMEPPITISVSGGSNIEPATATNQAFQSTSSDSESPTEPVSQPTIAQLRAKVVPSKAK